MKRQIAAGLAITAVAVGVGWVLASHPEKSTSLEDVSLVEHSEHSNPGPGDKLAGIRIRLSPSDLDEQRAAERNEPPKIHVVEQ